MTSRREARARSARSKLRKQAAGRCYRCGGRPPCVPKGRCRTCILRTAAVRHRASLPVVIAAWRKHKGRCAYSGVRIRLGVNASLEHVLPRMDGGDSGVDNIVWVDNRVNNAKHCMPITEFVVMCRNVLTHFGYTVTRENL